MEEYNQKLNDRYVDTIIILTCEVEVSLKRKYLNSLSVISKYFYAHSKKILKFDSTNVDKIQSALNISNKIIDDISDF